MKVVIMPRYLDTPNRIQEMKGGSLKTLAMGMWQRIAAQEVIEVDEAQDTCGDHYENLVTRVNNAACVFVEVHQSEPPRIQT
jgi:hypothetical protein